MFDEVVSAREALRNTSLRTDCHDFEVSTILFLTHPLHSLPYHDSSSANSQPLICYAVAQERCPMWASKGECGLNPNFMLRSCQKSCGLCGPGVDSVRTLTHLHSCMMLCCHCDNICVRIAARTSFWSCSLKTLPSWLNSTLRCQLTVAFPATEWCSGCKCRQPAYHAYAAPGCCADPACKGICTG